MESVSKNMEEQLNLLLEEAEDELQQLEQDSWGGWVHVVYPVRLFLKSGRPENTFSPSWQFCKHARMKSLFAQRSHHRTTLCVRQDWP